jgi:protein SCO1/2
MERRAVARGPVLTRHGYGPLALLGVLAVLVVLSVVRSLPPPPIAPGSGGTRGSAGSTGAAGAAGALDVSPYLLPSTAAAPPIELTDPSGSRFSLPSLRGHDMLVFFGYTHCPDVCPATIGIVGEAIRGSARDLRALFVTVDPERDTTAWLREYAAYLPAGITALTGSPTEIGATAGGWGVRYARVEGAGPSAYTMSHTADVYLVDATGRLRARFPFGTESAPMLATIAAVDASDAEAATAASTSAPARATSTPGGALALGVELTSTSLWAGPPAPAILRLSIGGRPLTASTSSVEVRVTTFDGAPVGSPTSAVPVRPPGVDAVAWVASVAFPAPGAWRLAVTAAPGTLPLSASIAVTALDPGATPALGAPAPTIHTPTVADAGGDIRAVTTDPAPDPRLSSTSTTDALAAHRPFVLVADSTRFRVTQACGKAVVLARFLADRWPAVAFIHAEPYRYSIVTDTPVLDGSLADPPLTDVAATWGIGGAPWGPLSMPWVFVVDGNGVVRAKAQGVIGSDDVDVILSLLAAEAAR